MTAAILALALAAGDEPLLYESYSELGRVELLQQRRLLKESEPVIFPAVLVTCAAPVFALIGAGLLVDGLSSFFLNKTPQNFAGGFLLAVGLGGLIGGVLWVVKTATTQKAVAARVEEIEALLITGGYVQPPPVP